MAFFDLGKPVEDINDALRGDEVSTRIMHDNLAQEDAHAAEVQEERREMHIPPDVIIGGMDFYIQSHRVGHIATEAA